MKEVTRAGAVEALTGTADRSTWERLPVAAYRAGRSGWIRDVNAAFVECFRSPTREALLGSRIDALYVDARDRARRAALAGSRGGIVRGFEAKMRRLDGTTFWGREIRRAEPRAEGGAVLHEGLIDDVSEERLAREELRLSELRYRRLFESATEGILILDAESAEVQDVNPYLCDLLGASPRELVGRKLWEIAPFEDVAASRVDFRELQQADYVRYEDLHLETARGVALDVEFVGSAYVVNDRRVIQCNVRDISERKRLSERHAGLVRVVEQSADAIVLAEPNGKIVYVNPAFERHSGWSRDDVVGRKPRFLGVGHGLASSYRQMRESLAHGDAWSGRLASRRPDASVVEEEVTVSPVRDDSGRVVHFVAAHRDVVDGPSPEGRQQRARQVESIGRLAGGLAHDFNNLLGIISGYSEMARARLAEEDPIHGMMSRILEAGERAAELTRQLLASGRRQPLQPTVLDVDALVAGQEGLLRRRIGESFELSTRLLHRPVNVRADPGQLEQVLSTLVFHARDAMPEGGRITVALREVELGADDSSTGAPAPPGTYVVLSVNDTGPGLAAEDRNRIFEPFFTTRELGRGTGLGLSTVDGIVGQSGGFVGIRGDPGAGTTLEVWLPRVAEAVQPASGAAPAVGPGTAGTILLVEDEPALRELVRQVLSEEGYSVLVAGDGAEALRIAAGHAGPIELLITDIAMPGMTGPRVAEAVVRVRPAIRVLFVSGYSDEAIQRDQLTGPARAFLSKPFGLVQLTRAIRELVEDDG
ncbi:MAG: hypothetical protein AMXMBFR36_33590 [Acidobacteriota bacterium]